MAFAQASGSACGGSGFWVFSFELLLPKGLLSTAPRKAYRPGGSAVNGPGLRFRVHGLGFIGPQKST